MLEFPLSHDWLSWGEILWGDVFLVYLLMGQDFTKWSVFFSSKLNKERQRGVYNIRQGQVTSQSYHEMCSRPSACPPIPLWCPHTRHSPRSCLRLKAVAWLDAIVWDWKAIGWRPFSWLKANKKKNWRPSSKIEGHRLGLKAIAWD